ncbi:MAG TPA: hypothetical protein DDZ80_07735 [Cyanobacteria bacterium UBA8803]|nr:hypothetical protein [Cyanobacteria bacterium UBA9273]HBL58399.1 hypothetical protein [Cyanobacteria bacterium UBA8803]
MAWQNLPLPLTLLCAVLSLELATAPSLLAQTQLIDATQVWLTFKPPKQGTPDKTASGATRGECLGDNLPAHERFSSLMPAYSETEAERPTFAVYIPHTAAQKVFFSLRDASEDYYYETEILLPATPGTYRLQLPANAPALVSHKTYQWSLSLICGQSVDPNDPLIGGVIQLPGSSN